ncbi:hypothetical protein GCM10029963_35620 [Micromonospora andamanensis]|uniref:hypothetical protein n=1 Tax=Micromonospora andamanensis TaxID=1287068 RepID=UPI00195225D5|nr:hypothetical protein [Micromonospora andamanensis]GIJ40085.1 hypothetical protein Vwe01_34100 [Micromonospora andamanensis]
MIILTVGSITQLLGLSAAILALDGRQLALGVPLTFVLYLLGTGRSLHLDRSGPARLDHARCVQDIPHDPDRERMGPTVGVSRHRTHTLVDTPLIVRIFRL